MGNTLKKNPIRYAPLAIAVAVFALSFHMLAVSPQNPDGAEMIMAALQGGVLHPPGFPLQAWLNRALVDFPTANIAYNMSLFSLVCHSLTGYFLCSILLAMRLSVTQSLFGALSYSLYPATWYLGVQPEKYALTLLLLAVFLWFLQKIYAQRSRLFSYTLLGALFGLGLSQHLLFLFVLPATVCLFIRRQQLSKLLAFLIPAVTLPMLFYSSLLLLSRTASWPDWGKVQTLSDAFRHAMRADFGFTEYASGSTHNAVSFFADDYSRSMTVGVGLLILGIIGIAKSRHSFNAAAYIGGFIMTLVFLTRCSTDWAELTAWTYLERYTLFSAFFAAILIAHGTKLIQAKLHGRPLFLSNMLITTFVLSLAVNGYERANASHDNVIDLYREGIGISLSPDAYYVTNADLEGFYGIKSSTGYRFALLDVDYDWYLKRGISATEPRERLNSSNPLRTHEIIEKAYQAGFEIASTSPELLKSMITTKSVAQQRGLLWVTHRSIVTVVSRESATAASKICEILTKARHPIPTQGHFFSRILWANFRKSFFGALAYFERAGDEKKAKVVRDIIVALTDGTNPNEWIKSCEQFQHEMNDG